jgi:hypothetical protein
MDAFYKKTSNTRTGKSFYIVCIGKFATSKDADNGLGLFKKTEEFKKFPDSFIKWMG